MKNFFLIVLIGTGLTTYCSASTSSSEDEPAAVRPIFPVGKPNDIALSKLPIVLFDEGEAPDKKYADKIREFKHSIEALMQKTDSGDPSFSIDLSRTYLTDEGVSNLLAFLSTEITSPTGVRIPLQYLRRLNLSNTHVTEDSLISLKDVLQQDGFEYLNVTVSGASNWESIQKLFGTIQTNLTEESIDRASKAIKKVIWLPATFLSSGNTTFPHGKRI